MRGRIRIIFYLFVRADTQIPTRMHTQRLAAHAYADGSIKSESQVLEYVLAAGM